MPLRSPSDLHAVLSYYTATGNLNPEGDVHINDLQGLGTDLSFLNRIPLALTVFLYNILSLHTLASLFPSAYAQTSSTSHITTTLGKDFAPSDGDLELELLPIPKTVAMWMTIRYYERKLTENTPQLGYFIAGGTAGVVSRTATAPLDRLKVYLIAQTGVQQAAVTAAKEGAPLAATANASRTLVIALQELWRAGGIRSLFAGASSIHPSNMGTII
jgi:solute carrier family 25 phosphate transporter 23/24/25/41